MQNPILEQVKHMALAMQRAPWEQGNLAQACLELGDERTTILLAKEAQLRQTADGRAAIIGQPPTVTDPCAVGEALIYAYEKTGDAAFKKAYERLLHWALVEAPRDANGIVYHLLGKPELWADSMYMLPPFLAAAGEYDAALKQLDGYWEALFVKEIGLLAHIWDTERQVFSRGVIWAEGNGWAIAAMAQIIDQLPEEYAPHQQRLIARTTQLIGNSLKYMRDDYFFHDAMDDPTTVVENGLSQLLAYGIYRGVTSGWLASTYIPAAEAMFLAVQSKVDDYGLVQDVCSAKSDFVIPGPNAEGQAWFIMLWAARARYQSRCAR
ncbi:MAG: glycoside hydrolase family 88 protein [Anaerolineae bacterium]|nr:glycoside hydrolase family 88 protein [Anaerolineae bacterium]